MLLLTEIESKGLEFYFKYDNLDIETILRLFKNIERMHDTIMSTTSKVYFNEKTQNRFRNILDLDDIHTGESIRIRFKEKWKVELKVKEENIEIVFPRKLGVPVIIFFFLLQAARLGIGLYNEYLDMELKKLDIELKQNELFQQMEETRRIDPQFNKAKRQAENTIKYIMDNDDITYFEINGVTIKD
ncbi:hypothetical protein [Algoriphagus formosus]|uniref:hypothetical protein n=1 Tax=Algoriphagus formosus TaxID=2007308 RepID=UPI003F725A0C